jgi:hypothetical protein
MERARHTEFGLDAHDSPLHVIELTCWSAATKAKPATARHEASH